MRIMGVWTLMFVSTKGNRGHTHTVTASWGASKKAPVANESGAASDCGRDTGAGSVGIESGPAPRRECQPGVLLAEALLRRTAGHDQQLPAGASRGRAARRGRERERLPSATRDHGN